MQYRPFGVRGLVFGGIMAALAVVCAMVPVVSMFMPIPLVLAYVRFGGRTSGLTAIVASLFAGMVIGPVRALILIPFGILPGLVIGAGFRHKWRPILIGLAAVLVFFLGMVTEYMVARAALGGHDPLAVVAESDVFRGLVQKRLDDFEARVQVSSDASPSRVRTAETQLKWIRDAREDPVGAAWAGIPLIIFLSGSFLAWFNFMLARWVVGRLGYAIPPSTRFGELRLPAWLMWTFAFLALGAGYAVGPSLLRAPWWAQVLVAVVQPLSLIFVLVGMAVAYGFLRLKDVPKPIAIAFTASGLLLSGWGMQIYMMLAMWDTVFDFRGLGHGLYKRFQESP